MVKDTCLAPALVARRSRNFALGSLRTAPARRNLLIIRGSYKVQTKIIKTVHKIYKHQYDNVMNGK